MSGSTMALLRGDIALAPDETEILWLSTSRKVVASASIATELGRPGPGTDTLHGLKGFLVLGVEAVGV
jgi:hypothetical protein